MASTMFFLFVCFVVVVVVVVFFINLRNTMSSCKYNIFPLDRVIINLSGITPHAQELLS